MTSTTHDSRTAEHGRGRLLALRRAGRGVQGPARDGVAGRRSGLSRSREVGSSGALPPGVSRRSLRVRARSCSCAKRSEKTSSDEEGQQRTDGQERDLTSGTGEERERQEETKRDLRQTKQWTTSTNRATQQATASKKVSQTFSQIRPHMSVFFCTASSRPSLGRRLRRRLGGREACGITRLMTDSSALSSVRFDQIPGRVPMAATQRC